MSFNSRKMLLSLALAFGLAVTAVAAQKKAKPPAKSNKATAASAPAQTTHAAHSADEVEVPRMTVEELKAKIEKKETITIIDSRSQGSYGSSDSKIKGSIRVPTDEVEAHLKEIPRDKPVVIYCT